MTAAERVLPHNIEAERSVLGAIVATFGKALDTIADQLKASDFYRDAHRRLYAAMVEMYTRGDAIDFITLKNELEEAGKLEEVGGVVYIAGLADGMPASTNVAYYARIVRDKSVAREVIAAASRMMTKAYEYDGPLADIVAESEQALMDVSTIAVPGDLVPSSEMVRQIYPVLEALTASRRPVTGLSTGFSDLDVYTRGLQPGNLIIVAGRPGQGKTTLVGQLSLHISQSTPVAYFSIEMNAQEHTFRVLSTLAQVDGHQLQCGQLTPIHQHDVGDALVDFAQRQFWLDDSANISALQIRSRARRLKAQHGLGAIVVDYLQLMHHPKADSREQQVAASSRLLLATARELGVPLIAVCQLSRAVEQRQDQRPKLSDLRESGSLEQDAHLVLLIHRPQPQPGSQDIPPTELIIAKQRNGPTGSIDLRWLREQYRFAQMEPHR